MRTSRRRAAFSLLEMMVAMVVMLVVFSLAVPFFRVQLRAINTTAGRLDAQQNVRFALASIERELRVAGGGVVERQPMIVEAADRAITFNVDLVTRDADDPSAVYYDADADPAVTTSLVQGAPVALPATGRSYPDTTYWESAGLTSRAETISYWVAPDPRHPGQYILYRRVNRADSTVVSSGILLAPDEPMFTYLASDSTGAAGTLTPISRSTLPITHTAAIHGSPADTGESALTDRIRMVRVQMTGVFEDPATGKAIRRRLEGDVRLLNAGLVRHSTCGNAPLGAALAVANAPDGILLSWPPSVDEAAGEKDVERYMVFRRSMADVNWGEPIASVGVGLPSYTYLDKTGVEGQTYLYGLAAQDCTPNMSPVSIAGPIVFTITPTP